MGSDDSPFLHLHPGGTASPSASGDDGSSSYSNYYQDSTRDYALTGKILLSAVVVLFFVVLLMLLLHLYTRLYLRRRRQQLHRNRRASLVFYIDTTSPNSGPTRGLDPALVKSIPTYSYSESDRGEILECAVCLSEFEEDEMVRLLPKCRHSFHVDCIDMWFYSHATCPLCRAPVEPVAVEDKRAELPVVIESRSEGIASGSGSGLCSACGDGEGRGGLTVEIPRRMASFKRLLSKGKRASTSSPATVTPSPPPSAAALDLERGLEKEEAE